MYMYMYMYICIHTQRHVNGGNVSSLNSGYWSPRHESNYPGKIPSRDKISLENQS